MVLPKWNAAVDPAHMNWGLKAGLIPPPFMPKKGVLDQVAVTQAKGVARPRLVGAAGTPFEGLTLTPGPIDSLQTFSAKGWTPVLTDAAGDAVIAQAPGSQVYVLSEPDLLNTQGLADLDTLGVAVSIVRALRTPDGPVIFDVTLNGYRLEHNPLQLMFTPPFLAVTLCAVAAMALAGLQAFFRFGSVRRATRAFALGKEALTDNSAQLIRLAGREGHMASPLRGADPEGRRPGGRRAARADRRGADRLPRPHGRPARPHRPPFEPDRRGRPRARSAPPAARASPRWPGASIDGDWR